MAERKDSVVKYFKDNVYQSKEFYEFCKEITGRSGTYPFLESKHVAVHSFSKSKREEMYANNKEFMAVLDRDNHATDTPSMMEYPIIPEQSFEDAWGNCSRTFRRLARKSSHLFMAVEHTAPNKALLDEVYALYRIHMKRVNGVTFERSFFTKYMQMPQSVLICYYYGDELAAYTFALQSSTSMYLSIGGAKKKYFSLNINYFVARYELKRACIAGLHLHMGLGLKESGANRFKYHLRPKTFSVESKSEETVRKLLPYMRVIGWCLRYYSYVFPKKAAFMIVPFT